MPIIYHTAKDTYNVNFFLKSLMRKLTIKKTKQKYDALTQQMPGISAQ